MLFILHADHEQNCSTNAMRSVASSGARIPEFLRRVKAGEAKLMGFGHRVYKNDDPRARIIKRMADEVFAVTRPSPLLPEMFTVMFAIPRTAGWLAQRLEMLGDPEQKIARPRQLSVGPGRRDVVPPGPARRRPSLGC